MAEEVEEDVGVDLSAGVVCIHNRQVDDCVADDEEILIEGGQVDVLAEEVEEDVGVDLSAGVVCKKMRNRSRAEALLIFYSVRKWREIRRAGRRRRRLQ